MKHELIVKVKMDDVDSLVDFPDFENYAEYFNRYEMQKYNPLEWGRLKLDNYLIIFEVDLDKE